MRRPLLLFSLAALIVAFMGVTGSTAPSHPTTPQQTAREAALRLLDNPRIAMTAAARAALRRIATRTNGFSEGPSGVDLVRPSTATGGEPAPSELGPLQNVRVNDPSRDSRQTDQTTQSETSVAVSGSHVLVGYNDSQQTLINFTAGSDLSGYSYSGDGGKTWTDGGDIPNAPGLNNVGDPWLASDRSGTMYYSTLQQDDSNIALGVAVARSTNGGRAWQSPVTASPSSMFYMGDKDAMAAGPDPSQHSQDNVYVAWDDFVFDPNTFTQMNGLPVSHSYDGGRTWSLVYADRLPQNFNGCSSSQYFGAQPLVDRATGTLSVVAQKIVVSDPHCTGGTVSQSEEFFQSSDGGKSFSGPVKIAKDTSPLPVDVLELGPAMFMRTADFPTLTARGNSLYAAWNDKGTGHYHIKLGRSTDQGGTWLVRYVTSGSNDEVQPALSADSRGLHLLYYKRNRENTLDVFVKNSVDGSNFTTTRVTDRSFPGVFTAPQFDPIIAFAYMGDYIANVSDGTHQYFAWGDNRGVVTDFIYPHGRHDPDVFFARQ